MKILTRNIKNRHMADKLRSIGCELIDICPNPIDAEKDIYVFRYDARMREYMDDLYYTKHFGSQIEKKYRQETGVKKVLSKAIAEELVDMGFDPIGTERNYNQPWKLVWLFENTSEFEQAFNFVMLKVKNRKKLDKGV